MINFDLDDVKTVPCKECGIDVTVNVNYPITEVSCQPWYCPKLNYDVAKTVTDGSKT
tara:strand:- start:1381 stop:1551 length:171 start_codon:yes stop_codon:yes gene_type:complete